MPALKAQGRHRMIAKELAKVSYPLTVEMIKDRFNLATLSQAQNALAQIDKLPDYELIKDRTGAFKTYVVQKKSESRQHKLWRLALFGEAIK